MDGPFPGLAFTLWSVAALPSFSLLSGVGSRTELDIWTDVIGGGGGEKKMGQRRALVRGESFQHRGFDESGPIRARDNSPFEIISSQEQHRYSF